jgi:glycine betaine/proline transport system ATP-binding protein
MTEPVSGDAVLASRTIRELARQLISDTRSLIPVAGADGAIIGVARRQDALDVLLGDGH